MFLTEGKIKFQAIILVNINNYAVIVYNNIHIIIVNKY